MKCFYHQDADASGICKNCQRALCRNCAGDGIGSLACPNRCEEAVAKIDKLITTNIRVTSSTTPVVFAMPFFFLLAGLGMILYAFYGSAPEGFYFLGAFSILFGVVRLVAIFRYRAMRA